MTDSRRGVPIRAAFVGGAAAHAAASNHLQNIVGLRGPAARGLEIPLHRMAPARCGDLPRFDGPTPQARLLARFSAGVVSMRP